MFHSLLNLKREVTFSSAATCLRLGLRTQLRRGVPQSRSGAPGPAAAAGADPASRGLPEGPRQAAPRWRLVAAEGCAGARGRRRAPGVPLLRSGSEAPQLPFVQPFPVLEVAVEMLH